MPKLDEKNRKRIVKILEEIDDLMSSPPPYFSAKELAQEIWDIANLAEIGDSLAEFCDTLATIEEL